MLNRVQEFLNIAECVAAKVSLKEDFVVSVDEINLIMTILWI